MIQFHQHIFQMGGLNYQPGFQVFQCLIMKTKKQKAGRETVIELDSADGRNPKQPPGMYKT